MSANSRIRGNFATHQQWYRVAMTQSVINVSKNVNVVQSRVVSTTDTSDTGLKSTLKKISDTSFFLVLSEPITQLFHQRVVLILHRTNGGSTHV